jgi:putative SOS response-associated peptidase YedK
MCGRVRDPNIEEVSEIKLNHFRRRRDRIRGDWRPGQKILVVILEGGAWKMEEMRWGLIPAGSESDLLDYSTYNARSERVSETRTYRNAWRQGRRCLIPAEGFYERKHYFTLRESPLMAFAGLWDEWKNPVGRIMRTCTMLTCTPNELVGMVHNRMPVIIARDDGEPGWAKYRRRSSR